MINILALTLDDLVREFGKRYGKRRFHAEALYKEILKNNTPDPWNVVAFQNVPTLSEAIQSDVLINPGTVINTFNEEGLIKFITRLSDGLLIESVLIPMTNYNTLCVSSQVGCKMGCRFCETGAMGFKRNLRVEEITGQLFNARHHLKKSIKNIVFMGMGEPFDNYDGLIQAIRVFNEQQGFDIALSHITISTAGMVSGIDRLAGLGWPQIKLAVSINAADDETRSRLMPINLTTPLHKLKQALLRYPLKKRGTFLMEYILIKGINDASRHAAALADFIHPLPVRLNLIPYNPVDHLPYISPSDQEMHRFKAMLTKAGVFVIARWTRGRSVTAGCGQLGRSSESPC